MSAYPNWQRNNVENVASVSSNLTALTIASMAEFGIRASLRTTFLCGFESHSTHQFWRVALNGWQAVPKTVLRR